MAATEHIPHAADGRWKVQASMFYVDGENELLVCQLCQKSFQSLSTAWLASPADGGAAIWTHRHCIDRHGERVLGSFRYRLRRGDAALRNVIQRLLTVDGFPPIVKWDRG